MFFRVIVDHKGCWSQLLSSYQNISAELLSQKVDGNGVIEGFVAFYYDGRIVSDTIWNDFFRDLKKQSTIVAIKRIESIKKMRSYIAKISAQQDDSMSDIMYLYDSPYFKEIFYRGYEIWYVYAWYENEDILIDEVKRRAKILDFKKLDGVYFINNVLPFEEEPNYHILKYAYENGYYYAKKQINLKTIAKNLNTSKSNVSRKLKKVENRAITSYIESRMDKETLTDLYSIIDSHTLK